MHVDTMENEASGFSLTASDNGAPIVHRTNTLYTDIPMYLQLIQQKAYEQSAVFALRLGRA